MSNSSTVTLHGKEFKEYINKFDIEVRIDEMAHRLSTDYVKPLFIAVLNGSFVFAADLLRSMSVDAEIEFVKVQSYDGMTNLGSQGKVTELIGISTSKVEGRNIILIEDIVDTGHTIFNIMHQLNLLGAASVSVCTLLHKPAAQVTGLKPDYIGFSIGNEFVVGYGLDYDGQGRNLPHLFIETK